MIATEPDFPSILYQERVVIRKPAIRKYTNSVIAKVSGGVERELVLFSFAFHKKGLKQVVVT